MSVLLCMIVAAIWVENTNAYPDGAPDRVCSNGLVPGHGRKEHGVSPYRVTSSSSRYSSNKPIRVRIESLSGEPFKGFVVQAQDSYGDAIIDGEWHSQDGKAIRKCGAITHRDSHDKDSVTLTWTPKHGSGPITFVATIAKTKKLYYHNIKADVVGGSSHKPSSSSKPLPSSSSSSSSHLFEPVEEDEENFSSHMKKMKLRLERPNPLSASSSPSVFTSWSMEAHHPHGGVSSSVSNQRHPTDEEELLPHHFIPRQHHHSLHRHSSRSFPPTEGLQVEELEFADASPSFHFVPPSFPMRGQGTHRFRHPSIRH